jgi:hypothetical protein
MRRLIIPCALLICACSMHPDPRPAREVSLISQFGKYENRFAGLNNDVTKKEELPKYIDTLSRFIKDSLQAKANNWMGLVSKIELEQGDSVINLVVRVDKKYMTQENAAEFDALVFQTYIPNKAPYNTQIKQIKTDDFVNFSGAFMFNGSTVDAKAHGVAFDDGDVLKNPEFSFNFTDIKPWK